MPGQGDEALLRAHVPGIHVLCAGRAKENVDGRDKPGHDAAIGSAGSLVVPHGEERGNAAGLEPRGRVAGSDSKLSATNPAATFDPTPTSHPTKGHPRG